MLSILCGIAVKDIAQSDRTNAEILANAKSLAELQAYLNQTRKNADLLEKIITREIRAIASQN